MLLFFLFFTGCPPDPTSTEPGITPTPDNGGTLTPTPSSTPIPTQVPLEADSYEPDNDYGSANEILYETDATGLYDQFHTIYPAGDYDWLYFSAILDETYIIELYPLPGGEYFDSYLELYDTNGITQLETDDDGGTGPYSKLTWTCPATGTYYMRTSEFGDSDVGHYGIYVMHLVSGIIEIVVE